VKRLAFPDDQAKWENRTAIHHQADTASIHGKFEAAAGANRFAWL
jgi:hypothetical protein